MRNFASTLVKFSKLSHIQTTIWRPPKMAPPPPPPPPHCGVSGALCYATGYNPSISLENSRGLSSFAQSAEVSDLIFSWEGSCVFSTFDIMSYHYSIELSNFIWERSHMTSAAEGGGGLKKLTVADKGGGVEALLTSAKILKFWQKLFQIKQAYHYA